MHRPGADASSANLCVTAETLSEESCDQLIEAAHAETLSEESCDQLIEAAHESPDTVDNDNDDTNDLNPVDTKDEPAQ